MSVTERNRGGLRVLAGVGATLGTALAAWTLRQLLRSPTDAVLDLLIIVPSSLAAALGWWFAIRATGPVRAPCCDPGVSAGWSWAVPDFSSALSVRLSWRLRPIKGQCWESS